MSTFLVQLLDLTYTKVNDCWFEIAPMQGSVHALLCFAALLTGFIAVHRSPAHLGFILLLCPTKLLM